MKLASKFIAAVLLALAASTVLAQTATPVTGSVYQTSNVRSGPDTRYQIVGQLSEGDIVSINGKDDDGRWLRVVLPTAATGWLPTFALIVDGDLSTIPVIADGTVEGTVAPNANVSVISYGRVNVRGGPGIGFEIVGQLDVNEHAAAIARSNRQNDWLLIRLNGTTPGSATEGWVAYFTVNVQGDPRALPVLVPDSSGDALIPPSRLLRTLFNVRLHNAPQLTAPVTLVVPFDSEVTPIGRNANGDWIFVGYDDQTGWGVAQLFDITNDELAALPIYGQSGTRTTSRTDRQRDSSRAPGDCRSYGRAIRAANRRSYRRIVMEREIAKRPSSNGSSPHPTDRFFSPLSACVGEGSG